MSARERECGELPSPICPCLTERLSRDFLFSSDGGTTQLYFSSEKDRGRPGAVGLANLKMGFSEGA